MTTGLLRQRQRSAIFIVLIWTVLAIASAGINVDSLWYDEYLSLYFAGWPSERLDLLSIINRIVSSSEHRVLTYDLILAGWSAATGWAVFSARYLSLLFGILAIAWTYRLGNEMWSAHAGLYAAIFLGAAGLLIVYMHEARTYTFWLLMTVLLLWLYWRLLHAAGGKGIQTSFALLATATLYTHPLSLAILGPLGLYHVLLAPRNALWRRTFLLFILASLLYLPWALPTTVTMFDLSNSDARSLTARGNAALLLQSAPVFSNGLWPMLFLPLLTWRRLRHDPGLRLLWCFGLGFLFAMLLAHHFAGILNHFRYLLPLLAVIALLCGIGCASLARRPIVVLLILALWSAAGYYAQSEMRKTLYSSQEHDVFHFSFPFKEITSLIRDDGQAGDAVFFEFPYHSWALAGGFDYYMHGAGMDYVLADTLRAKGKMQLALNAFAEFIAGKPRLYFVLDRTIDPTPLAPEYERILGERFAFCGRLWDTVQVKIDKYAKDEAHCHLGD